MKKRLTTCLSKQRTNLFPLLIVCLMGSMTACAGDSTPGDEVLVKFGEVELLREEVDLFTPDGLSAEDSTRYADQYVDHWISLQAMAREAATEVSGRDRDLQYKMARYKDQLISQMFAEKLASERPELYEVTDGEIEGYYNRHIENFVAETNYYQYFYLKTALNGQYQISGQMKSSSQEDIDALRAWARDNAVSWKLDSTYRPEADLLKRSDGYYFGDITRAYINTVYPYAHEEEETRYYDFLRILDKVNTGESLPLSLCRQKIAQIIRNERKNAYVEETRAILVSQSEKNGVLTDYRTE